MNEINRQRLGPATALFYAIKETWFVIDASWNFIISMYLKAQEIPLN